MLASLTCFWPKYLKCSAEDAERQLTQTCVMHEDCEKAVLDFLLEALKYLWLPHWSRKR